MNRHFRRTLTTALTMMLATASQATAVETTISLDDPGDLSGQTFLANQTVRQSDLDYSLRFDGPAEGLGPALSINALALREDGGFLFAGDAPFDAGGQTWEARDIVLYAGGSYSLNTRGADLGLSPSAVIDALAILPDGALALSFEEPETIGGTNYLPADVLRLDGGAFSLLFDAAAAGLDGAANVTGYDRGDDGSDFLGFQEPTNAGGTTYLPGQVVRYSSGNFSLFVDDPAFPADITLAALSLPGSPGRVENLLVDRQGSDLSLQWDPTCSSDGDDYAVYEGTIGDFASHQGVACSTGGSTSAVVAPAGGQRYYLVVPLNGTFEGSYGGASDGTERSAGLNPCREDRRIRPCP